MKGVMNAIVSSALSIIGIYFLLNNKKMTELFSRYNIVDISNKGPSFFTFQRFMVGIVGVTFLVVGVWGIIVAIKGHF
ncbi:MAG: hypothetical protein KAQ99_06165 [Candidatus Aureabacteria bacterium]|nr:hypothetical protein [Candidatus Auribacterota bacterium]